MQMPIIQLLDQVAREVEFSVNSELNRGGCAVYAALVARWLKQETPVDVAVSDDESWITIGEAREMGLTNTADLCEWNERGLIFGHVVLDFEHKGQRYWYDSNGVVAQDLTGGCDPTYHFPILAGRLTVEETIKLAREGNWNRQFDRNEIPKIKSIVDRLMSKYFSQQPEIDY
jgi:hypothetical protein